MCAFINVNPRHHVDMRQKTNAKNNKKLGDEISDYR
jgi:hypothetical protein